MKKWLWVFLGFMGFAGVTACGPVGEQLDVTRAKALVAGDTDQVLQVPIDTVLVVKLPVNLTTGWAWKLVSDGGIFELVYDSYVADSDLLGAPGVQLFYLTGRTHGAALVEFGLENPDKLMERVTSYQAYSQGAFEAELKIPEKDELPAGQYVPSSSYLPTKFDWCEEGFCPPVRQQGMCGSCWAFATVVPLEVNIARANGGSAPDLSEQYLVSCNNDDWSCDGGWFAHAYHVNKKVSGEKEAGAVTEKDRPYTGKDDPCNPPNPKTYQGKSWGYVTQDGAIPSAEKLKQAIYDRGPVSVAVVADNAFQNYSGGVFQGSSNNGIVNHAVALVGWDGNVFRLKNSWGTNWGEKGYMRIQYGANKIGYSASYIDFGGDPGPTPTPDPNPTPTPDPTPNPGKSCKNSSGGNYCGQKSPDGCWCDNLCEQYEDCCPDKKSVCDDPQPTPTPNPTPTPDPNPGPNSCVGYCGGKAPGGCWCDTMCDLFGDCCGDKKQACGY